MKNQSCLELQIKCVLLTQNILIQKFNYYHLSPNSEIVLATIHVFSPNVINKLGICVAFLFKFNILL